MSLRRSGMSRFERVVNVAMEDLFPGDLEVNGVSYEGGSSGGRQVRDFDDHGLPVIRTIRMVRVRKELLEECPVIGQRVMWTPEGGDSIELRVKELPKREHEEAWAIVCEEP